MNVLFYFMHFAWVGVSNLLALTTHWDTISGLSVVTAGFWEGLSLFTLLSSVARNFSFYASPSLFFCYFCDYTRLTVDCAVRLCLPLLYHASVSEWLSWRHFRHCHAPVTLLSEIEQVHFTVLCVCVFKETSVSMSFAILHVSISFHVMLLVAYSGACLFKQLTLPPNRNFLSS